jgi:galactonate dehydratase
VQSSTEPNPAIVAVRRRSHHVSWRTTWDFVEIVTSDGRVGLGEWSDAGAWQTTYPAFDPRAGELVGLSVASALDMIAATGNYLAAQPPSPARRLQLTIVGGLDAALCDLASQSAGLPLADWLVAGAAGNHVVRCYGNINRGVDDRTVDRVVQVVKEAVASGFDSVKLAPFDFLVGARRLSAGLELAAAVRETAGPDAELMLDLHNNLSVDEVLMIGVEWSALGLRWLEDVAAMSDIAGHQKVRDQLGIPLAAGEFCASPDEIRPLLEAGVLDVFMPDVKHAGGPRRALELSLFAAEFGAQISPHNPTGPVAAAHSAALCAAVRAGGRLELALQESHEREGLLTPHEHVVKGTFHQSSGPGLGAELSGYPLNGPSRRLP